MTRNASSGPDANAGRRGRSSRRRWWLVPPAIVVGVLVFHVVFDLPGLFYDERGWDLPTNPQEKAAYDYAHALEIPRVAPKEAVSGAYEYPERVQYAPNRDVFRFIVPHPRYDRSRAVGPDNPSNIEITRSAFPYEPVPFNFAWARLRAMVPGQPAVDEQYFEHLCQTEAGDYVFRRAENVEGVFQMRPRPRIYGHRIDYDRYALEEPTGIGAGDSDTWGWGAAANFVQPLGGKYLFLEQPSRDSPGGVTRYIRGRNDHPPDRYSNGIGVGHRNLKPVYIPFVVAREEHSQRRARYGFTWRGIKRAHDRRHSIAAGEYLIVDLDTREVLAVKRAFKLSGKVRNSPSHIWWGNALWCKGMEWEYSYLVRDVLRPIPDLNERFLRDNPPVEFDALPKEIK